MPMVEPLETTAKKESNSPTADKGRSAMNAGAQEELSKYKSGKGDPKPELSKSYVDEKGKAHVDGKQDGKETNGKKKASSNWLLKLNQYGNTIENSVTYPLIANSLHLASYGTQLSWPALAGISVGSAIFGWYSAGLTNYVLYHAHAVLNPLENELRETTTEVTNIVGGTIGAYFKALDNGVNHIMKSVGSGSEKK